MFDAPLVGGRSKKSIEIVGKKFGILTVVAYLGRRHKSTLGNGKKIWASVVEAICECGTSKRYDTWVLTSGQAKSCGCVSNKIASEKRIKHGCSRNNNETPEYRTWLAMTQRCYTPTTSEYKNYGGRGIAICSRWRGEDGFANFLLDMGRKPSTQHSIDRYPNPNGNYEPTNCRWATREQQANNTTRSKWYLINGQKITQAQGMKLYGIKTAYLFNKIYKHYLIVK